jgi:hypothetical protein
MSRATSYRIKLSVATDVGVAANRSLTTGRRVDASCVSLGEIRAKESLGKPLPTSSHVPRRNAGIESVLNWTRCGLRSRNQR